MMAKTKFSSTDRPSANRVLGQEVRAAKYMHWWTFLAAYQEIGECTFAQIVRIRDRLARGPGSDRAAQISSAAR